MTGRQRCKKYETDRGNHITLKPTKRPKSVATQQISNATIRKIARLQATDEMLDFVRNMLQ